MGTSPRGERREKRSWPRRVARALGWFLLGLVLLVAGALLWVTSSWGEATLRDAVVARVGEKVRGTVRLDAIEVGLGAEVGLRGLVISDEQGREVIALDELAVDLALTELRGDHIPVESVRLEGLRVAVEQYEDGGSNLKNLFITSDEPKPEAPKKRRRIEVRSISIEGVDATVLKPDGTRIAVQGLGLDAAVDVIPLDRTFDVRVPRLGLALTLEKPDGLRLSVSKLSTGLAVAVTEGKGDITLSPTSADIELTRSGQAVQSLSISLAEVGVKIGDEGVDGALDKLLAGALVLDQLRIHGHAVDGALVGDQRLELTGLHVRADELNALLGKQVLASDVELGLAISGPPGRLVLESTIETSGGTVRLAGQADVTDRESPGYDVSLKIEKLATARLLGPGMDRVPPIEIDSLAVDVKGKGRDKAALTADVGIVVEGTRVKGITIDRVEVDAEMSEGKVVVSKGEVEALGQKLALSGRYALATKDAHAELSLSGDVGEALERAREAGLPVQTRLPRGAVRLREGDLTIVADGNVAGALAVDVDAPGLPIAGGTLRVDAHADLERNPPDQPDKKVALRRIDAHVALAGIHVEQVLALRGKALPDLSVVASGTVDVEGTLVEPHVGARLTVRARRTDLPAGEVPAHAVAVLAADVVKTRADVDLTLSREGGGSTSTLLSAKARVPLHIDDAHRGIAQGGPLRADVSLPDRELSEILELLPGRLTKGKTLPPGRVGLDLHVEGTPAAPRGTLALRAEAEALGGKTQKLALRGDIETRDKHLWVGAEIDAWLDREAPRAIVAKAEVDLSRSPLLPGPKELAWKADLELTPQRVSKLPITSEKLQDVDAVAKAKLSLSGTKTDVLGDVRVQIEDAHKGPIGPLAVDLHAVVGETQTEIDLATRLDGRDAVAVKGEVGVPGRGLIPFIKDKKLPEAALDVDLTVARRPLASLAKIRPKLEGMPGELSGQVHVGGVIGRPLAKGALAYDRFETVSGEEGRVDVELEASEHELSAAIGLGPGGAGPAPSPVMISALVSRPELDTYRSEETATLTIAAAAHARAVDLRRLVPKAAVPRDDLKFEGQLDSRLDARVVLDKTPEARGMREGTALGELSVSNAAVVLPGSTRRYHGIELRLEAGQDALRIERLSLRESDKEKADRRVDVTGEVAWSKLRPTAVTVGLTAKDWLVFGGSLGATDAPRGVVSAKVRIDGKLDVPVKPIAVRVEALELLVPDRFERAHQPEETSLGDVYRVGGEAPAIGKLPVPASVSKKAEQAKKAAAAPGPTVADAGGAPAEETGLDVTVTLPPRAHILQSPMDLYAKGGLSVKVRPEGRTVRGRIDMVGGSLSLGGQDHPLKRGHIFFDEKCPTGCLDLFFAKRIEDGALRDVSLASAGDEITIHMTGPLSDRKTVLGGAASPGTLFDLLSVHNAGRSRYVTEPDLPATMTAQFPQHDNLLLLSYLGVNLPHMLFMDRVAAWADPYDGPRAYGRVQHLEIEAYDDARSRRVRVVSRPPEAGASESEVQLDWLFSEPGSRAEFGVGVEAGSRLGGGPGVFFEWSSED